MHQAQAAASGGASRLQPMKATYARRMTQELAAELTVQA